MFDFLWSMKGALEQRVGAGGQAVVEIGQELDVCGVVQQTHPRGLGVINSARQRT
ncbi:hypothetical protein [Streptomyces yanii]|uniref:Uncharacterized protein n=1 Tax=Streptomyces yanii TaxID=78510 RepID=A0ABV5R3M1_9ACTN